MLFGSTHSTHSSGAIMKNQVEVLPGKFIKYEISDDLVEELAKLDIDPDFEMLLVCKYYKNKLGEKHNDR